jgi:hypothetical protein
LNLLVIHNKAALSVHVKRTTQTKFIYFLYRSVFMSLSNSALNLKLISFAIVAVLFISLMGINNNVGATLILENQVQAESLQQEFDNMLNSFNNMKTDFNIIKQSLIKIFDIIIEKQTSPGIYYENPELPPLPPTNQSITSQFDSELPPLPPTNQSITSQFDSEL